MICKYKYFPRALRHFKDFLNHINDLRNKEFYGFKITSIEQDGIAISIKLENEENERYANIVYYRFGFMSTKGDDSIDENIINSLSDDFWSYAFKNSIISTTTFNSKFSKYGSHTVKCADLNDDSEGFYNSVLEILNGIGDFNRVLFKELEDLYNKSPYNKFIDLVQDDRFSSLSIHYTRLQQIGDDINEFLEYYNETLNVNSIGKLKNIEGEVKYLIKLVELTRSFFEKRYSTSIYIRESKRTRTALIISIIACLAALFTLLPMLTDRRDKHEEGNKSIEMNRIIPKESNDTFKGGTLKLIELDTLN